MGVQKEFKKEQSVRYAVKVQIKTEDEEGQKTIISAIRVEDDVEAKKESIDNERSQVGVKLKIKFEHQIVKGRTNSVCVIEEELKALRFTPPTPFLSATMM